jgi:hypothetical protein
LRAALAALASLFVARIASAQELDVKADEVDVDVKMRELELRGHVMAQVPPFFFLSADRLHLTRSGRGVEVDGNGKLRFCPCLGTPLAIRFSGGTAAPPGDLVIKSPVLEVFGLPVFWLPWFWVRSPIRPGILPPDIAYRASDGFFFGGGFHLPWTQGDAEHGIDIRGGGYVQGGFDTQATIATESSTTRVRFDHLASSKLGENGLTIDARGAIEGSNAQLAWDADLVRGQRGLYATTDLESAARAYDRAGAEAAMRSGPFTFALGTRAIGHRGAEDFAPEAVGPVATVRAAGDLGGSAAYDATADGAVWKAGDASVGFARWDAGSEVATHAGPIGARASVRSSGAAASWRELRGVDAGGTARATFSLPLARGFGTSADPVRQRIEPRIDIAASAVRADGVLSVLTGRGATPIAGEVLLPSAGIETALGRWGAGDGLEAGVYGGGAVKRDRAQALLRYRMSANSKIAGVVLEGGHVADEGHAFSARLRLGRTDGFALFGHVSGREGVDPVVARAIVDSAAESSVGFLAQKGWSTGGRVRIPLFKVLALSGGADADLGRLDLLAAIGGIELFDGCGCFVLRVMGAHRLGREGVDVWATLDVAPRRPR